MLSASTAAVTAVVFVLASALPASAIGVGDLSAAVLYGPTAPIGSILEDLDNGDDATQNVALPFPINFNGVRATALCVTTNGYVVPLAAIADSCDADAYDSSMLEGALYTEQSNIGVLLHDIDTGAPQWASAGVDLQSFDASGGTVTFVTSAAHGYSVGDAVDFWFPAGDAPFGYFYQETVEAVIDGTTFTVFDGGIPDSASQPIVGQTKIGLDDVTDDSDSDGHADDGFGAFNQVYAGATTVSGKPAFAITWYRVTSYEALNSPALSDTFQIVIIRDATPGAATDGYNFTVYFNFGTVADNDLQDGYDVTDPAGECDPLVPANCRFAVGFSFYDADTDTATSQELFATIPKAELIDGGAQALVSNSLDSGGVAGRYVLAYVGPATPQLAATGSDGVVPLALAALVMLSAGGVLMLVRRRVALKR